jgi:AcrR family transcriptional regulator
MARLQGIRERARAETTAAIVAEARRQLAEQGAAGLSLRAVSRELGVVSSAVYRYVASRDELLTLLIIDAYDDLGAAAEQTAAASAGRPAPERWVAVARAVRAWAIGHRHEYALVYGSPVPGYEAPQDTVAPAARVSLALIGVVRDAAASGQLHAPPGDVPVALVPELAALAEQVDLDVAPAVVVRTLAAWTQLFGMLSFELFGQTKGAIEHHAELFDTTVATMAVTIGLRPA